MKRLARWLLAGTVLLVLCAVWGLGGPAEAWATRELDGWHVVPMMPMRTCYPSQFSQAALVGVTSGDSPESVRSRIGEPFAISWGFGERRFVWFEPRNGTWVSVFARDVDVPDGTPMHVVAASRSHRDEWWVYSRSCKRDESRRMRTVSFEHGRVSRRDGGVWYD